MADNPRTEKVTHPDKGTHMVTPEAAVALVKHNGWTRAGGNDQPSDADQAVAEATQPLLDQIADLEGQLAAAVAREAALSDQALTLTARIEELEAQLEAAAPPEADVMPDNAADVVAWIGSDPERARQAAEAEAQRPNGPRKTVTDHIESVTKED